MHICKTVDSMGKQDGPCWWFMKTVTWIPVIFILTVIVWSYYAYVVGLCFYTIDNYIQKAFYLIFYHAVFLMFLWSYWQTVFTDLIAVPDKFRIPDVEMEKFQQAETEEAHRQILERFAQDLPVTNLTIKGVIRFCEKCQLIKPDRAHHCNVCRTCVLKMDHHCPWVNNCIGFHNYKFFMLFLAYALLYSLFVTATSIQYVILFCKGDGIQGMSRFQLFLLFFVALMFTVTLNSLFLYHCYLVLRNRSTLEAFTPPMFRTGKDKNGFSLGKYKNFQEVFGDNPKLWFLPVFTSFGDGVNFPERLCNEDTHTLLGHTAQQWGDETELDSPPPYGSQAGIV
ncbi:palmitoyltransferase ZDHHC15B isoform X4 [Halictus rubicundus]|uniref:palmitoyltransferase ZDHHC15B isoform X4 n=1 Tax=Halictus rubicundus TaxID=77578 RepID=UPI00403729EF